MGEIIVQPGGMKLVTYVILFLGAAVVGLGLGASAFFLTNLSKPVEKQVPMGSIPIFPEGEGEDIFSDIQDEPTQPSGQFGATEAPCGIDCVIEAAEENRSVSGVYEVDTTHPFTGSPISLTYSFSIAATETSGTHLFSQTVSGVPVPPMYCHYSDEDGLVSYLEKLKNEESLDILGFERNGSIVYTGDDIFGACAESVAAIAIAEGLQDGEEPEEEAEAPQTDEQTSDASEPNPTIVETEYGTFTEDVVFDREPAYLEGMELEVRQEWRYSRNAETKKRALFVTQTNTPSDTRYRTRGDTFGLAGKSLGGGYSPLTAPLEVGHYEYRIFVFDCEALEEQFGHCNKFPNDIEQYIDEAEPILSHAELIQVFPTNN